MKHSKSTKLSSTDLTISVSQVSKMYPLYSDPRERLKQSLWYALPQFIRKDSRQFYEEFWALRDISFEVKKGQTVGIIGRNGSGKSTLLQIIAGTLAPTQGEVQVNGRVAALLELGSGFNPEFTGRENVYLNGSILGLSRDQIDELFDDIAEFAEIGQFMEQPVKLYSSGMMVRLAFAVQAMVPKEILIVDEALAVGDEAFQRKCMRALEEFQEDGGSILLVSHDTQMINRRCQEAILLVEGKMLLKDRGKLVTDTYQRLLYGSASQRQEMMASLQHGTYAQDLIEADVLPLSEKSFQKFRDETKPVFIEASYDPVLQQPIAKSYGNGKAEISHSHLTDEDGKNVNVVIYGYRYHWHYQVHFKQDAQYVHFGMMIKTIDGVCVYATSTQHEQEEIPFVERGSVVEVTFSLDLNLAPATYFLNCGVSAAEVDGFVFLHRLVDAGAIRVVPRDERNVEGIAFLNHQISYKINKE